MSLSSKEQDVKMLESERDAVQSALDTLKINMAASQVCALCLFMYLYMYMHACPRK